jgi:hypothetical protein
MEPAETNLWYFAYGSNINLKRFQCRMESQGVPILGEKLVILQDYALNFCKINQ